MKPILPIYEGPAGHQFLAQRQQQANWNLADKDRRHCQEAVEDILKQVSHRGDEALRELSERFGDGLPDGEPIALPADEWEVACQRVPAETRQVLDDVASTIEQFARLTLGQIQLGTQTQDYGEYQASVTLEPVEKAGCYVPGGRYPLVSSALMTAIPARVAGVPHIHMACPNPSDALLYAARIAGVQTFYRMGGAQAIAAWTFGTESVAPVSLIAGPGNRYVTEAKRLLSGWVGIDMIAGPSEVAIIADATARPEWLAADLLAQAEHDPMARVFLLTDSRALAQAVQPDLERQMRVLRMPPYVKHDSLANSGVIVLDDLAQAVDITNALAPEHLQLHGPQAEALAEQLVHYGTLFIGEYATVPFGDYAAGPNHTLPTGRSARFASALSPLTFLRVKQSLNVRQASQVLSSRTQVMAGLEGLAAHAHAAWLRH